MILRCCIAALLLTPLAAHAQGNPGPFGGLFGRTPERVGRDFTALEFRTSVAGQYEDAVFLDGDIPAENVPKSGATSGGHVNLAFERQNDRLLIRTSGGATYQEFYQSPTFGATTYMASAMLRGKLTTRLEAGVQARYLRSPFFRLVPGGAAGPTVVAPADPHAVLLLTNDSHDVSAEFLAHPTKRSSFRGSVGQRQMRWQGGSAGAFEAIRGDAHWERRLNKSFTLRAGYGREHIVHTHLPGTEYVHELLDLGLDFSKQLSLDSRSAIAVTTQTSMVKRPTTGGREYRLNGSLIFSRLFGRTGQLNASLRRATQFLPGFVEPMNSDSVTASVTGMLSQRTEWLTDLSAGRGRFVDTDDPFLIAQLTNRLNYALTRRFGVFAQYAVYYHTLPGTQTQFALFGNVSRQALTLGINTWVPILNRTKVPRDPE